MAVSSRIRRGKLIFWLTEIRKYDSFSYVKDMEEEDPFPAFFREHVFGENVRKRFRMVALELAC